MTTTSCGFRIGGFLYTHEQKESYEMSKEWRTHTTPEEKYLHDPHYHQLVDVMRNMIRKAEFTPSELREAALFAAIIEEKYNAAPPIYPYETNP